MAISTADFKTGLTIEYEGNVYQIIEFQHVKPGKGGAFVRSKLKSILSGKVVDRTFNAGVKVDTATVDKRQMSYLYNDGDSYVFMDTETYDQTHVSPDTVGEASHFMLENQDAIVAVHEGNPLYLELPASVELVIEYTEPGLQGDRVSGASKPATLETGAVVGVPLFINVGETVKVDTRSGEYISRA